MNPGLDTLHAYPFERLAALMQGVEAPAGLAPVSLSLGEPRTPVPRIIADTLTASLDGLGRYPVTHGLSRLREAIADWLTLRFELPHGTLDPGTMVLPLNGTREGLFAFAQAIVDRSQDPIVAMPNPFYQIYEGAALLAGARPYYLDTRAATAYLPDIERVPAQVWKRCQLLYVCTPGNPTGAVMDIASLTRLIELADRYDFVVASDECYSEIYPDEAAPPPGLLEACARIGRHDFRRCVVFNSLSKRSGVPGLRSGFVAGDAKIMAALRLYRTYHGSAVPLPTQCASIPAWRDETHVAENRRRYRRSIRIALDALRGVLETPRPQGGFFLWPRTPIDGETFTRELYARSGVTLLPGAYLARDGGAGNPGNERVRISLVCTEAECHEAMRRIGEFVHSL